MNNFDKYLLIFAGALVALGLVAALGVNLGRGSIRAEQLQAQAVCDRSHLQPDGGLEQACGRLLEATGTEYICNQAGNCWLEVK